MHEGARTGMVYIVGAGPGDPELITLKGVRCLQAADVVLYDRLVDPGLLHMARCDAEHVFVGKSPACHTIPQHEINTLLIAYARQGRVVVRLKGGDPFIFGRGGEEALALAKAGIPFEIVPGVTSASAVPAYAGIPITQRGYTSTVTIVTGHEGHAPVRVNWQALAELGGTLVVLMGVRGLPYFTQCLIEAGLSPDMPAAVIQEGTTHRQRMVKGTLADIAKLAAEADLSSPAITVIGTVVSLSETLAWYQHFHS